MQRTGEARGSVAAAGSSPAPARHHWPFLDLVRFGAALLVLFGHTRGLYFQGFAHVEDASVLTRAFYLATGLQHEGVILFFVVSGFLVGGSAWRALAAGRFDPVRYLIDRFARIYLVLVPALLLVAVLNVAGAGLFADTRFYGVRPLMPAGVTAGWTWSQIPCHLAVLQGPFCLPWGANPPLWSLGWEWIFYLLAPVLFAILLRAPNGTTRAVGLVCFGASVVTLLGLEEGWPLWAAAWLAGVGAARLAERGAIPAMPGLAGLALCAAGLVLSRLAILPGVVTDGLVAFGLAAALASAAIAASPVLNGLAGWGARLSYSLYLVHLPVAIFAGAVLERMGWPRDPALPGFSAYGAFALTVLVALAVAYGFARLTEDRTSAFRAWLMGLRPGKRCP